jgi:hypothetical protein
MNAVHDGCCYVPIEATDAEIEEAFKCDDAALVEQARRLRYRELSEPIGTVTGRFTDHHFGLLPSG